MMSFDTKSHLIQYEKYINRLKEFGLHPKNQSYFISALIVFDKSYNFFKPII